MREENLVIIGAGPAGISAALYAVRASASPLIISKGIGALQKAKKIENFYGGAVSGQELYENGVNQARDLGVSFLETEVLGMEEVEEGFQITTPEGIIHTQSVILATGSRRSAPKIPGLKELEGKGVSYCAVCDAFFYRKKKAAVLGNSDFALHEAEVLSNLAAEVTILTNGKEENFSRECPFPVETAPIARLDGEKKLEGVTFEDGSGIGTDGLFVALGTAGSAEIARQMGAELTEKGHVVVDSQMQTSIPGLYAAGDCTGGLLQISKAVYEGTVAGIEAAKYVKSKKNKIGKEN